MSLAISGDGSPPPNQSRVLGLMVETLIRNGRVYDGTGSDWFGASVATDKAGATPDARCVRGFG